MVKPLYALLVRLKKLHVKVGQEDRKNHLNFQIRKAITAHDMLEKLLEAMYKRLFPLWLIWKGLVSC